MEEELEEYLGDDDDEEEADGSPSEGRRMQDALKAILAKLKGRPAGKLEDEGHAGYLAATTILEHVDGENAPRTPFEVKHFLWDELLEQHRKALGNDAGLFEYLANGRPLFGRTINNECLYAWFGKDEAVRLRDAAKRLARVAGLDDEVVEVLTHRKHGLAGCIDAILAKGYDVWAETT